MNSRLKKLLGGIVLSSTLFCVVPKADPLPVNEQVNQDDEEGIFETIYDKIAGGDTNISVSNDDDLGIRPDIDVDDPPKQDVPQKNRSTEVKEGTEQKVEKSSNESMGSNIANFAKSLVGKPYVYGSTGPNSFDCSGFVVYVYKKFGINLPRTSQAQAYVGKRISKSELQPGDLVFSNTYSSLYHVGVYIGNGQFVHAANSSTGVTISNINDGYYGPRYAWSTRPY